MCKRLSFAGSLALFVTVSGISMFITQITLSEVRHFTLVDGFTGKKHKSVLERPTAFAINDARMQSRQQFISRASFDMPATGTKAEPDQAGGERNAATVNKVEIDLGEIYIRAHDMIVHERQK
jgi:hypothetical protein